LNGYKKKGKEYNKSGEIIFEGEYLNGKRWNGNGKEFKHGKLICEVEYSEGKINEHKEQANNNINLSEDD